MYAVDWSIVNYAFVFHTFAGHLNLEPYMLNKKATVLAIKILTYCSYYSNFFQLFFFFFFDNIVKKKFYDHP